MLADLVLVPKRIPSLESGHVTCSWATVNRRYIMFYNPLEVLPYLSTANDVDVSIRFLSAGRSCVGSKEDTVS
jgi:hypothetical protein